MWDLAEHFGVTEDFMRKVVCWYTYGKTAIKEEFTAILKDIFFEHEQDRVWFKVTDFYYWDAEYYPPGTDEPVIIHDLDALPALSKFFGRRIANCHVSDRGIWFECEPKLPRKKRK